MKIGVRKEIMVHLDDKTFSLKITDKKKKFIVSGKITEGVPYASNFSFKNSVLTFTPTLSNHTFESVDKEFDKMLKENE